MNEFLRYIENVLDAALSNDASTIKQSYKVKVEEDVPGILFIPRFPTNLILNTETYYKIYDIISPAVYPKYTCVRPSSFIHGKKVSRSDWLVNWTIFLLNMIYKRKYL